MINEEIDLTNQVLEDTEVFIDGEEVELSESENSILPSREFREMDKIANLQKKKNELRKALHEKGILPKGAHNDYDNYEYFSEAQYKELFTELFSKYGIELYIDELAYEPFDGTDKQPFGRKVTLSCTLIDVDTGYGETSRHTGEALDRGDKAGYKATTGAIKRFLSSTFLVATKDDPEREDDKASQKKVTTVTTKKASVKKTLKRGTITDGQLTQIKKIFKDDVEKLKKIMTSYNKKKIEELSEEEVKEIIEKEKRDK